MARLLRRDLIQFGLLAAGILLAAPLRAEEIEDQDRARRAVERGEALPLADILARVQPELGGEIVRVSFERDGGRWVYEFKVIEPEGRLVEVYVDAASAQVLKREDK